MEDDLIAVLYIPSNSRRVVFCGLPGLLRSSGKEDLTAVLCIPSNSRRVFVLLNDDGPSSLDLKNAQTGSLSKKKVKEKGYNNVRSLST